MRPDCKKTFYFQADGHSLGGHIKQPSAKMIASQAHSSLPAVGGDVTTSTGAFSHDSIISCRATYTTISGREHKSDGPWSMAITSVIEGLNILEVVTAERIVAQINIEHSVGNKYPIVSFVGSRYEQLKVSGYDVEPKMNTKLLNVNGSGGNPVNHKLFQKVSREQGGKIVKSAVGADAKWVRDRFGWMDSSPGEDRCVLCSLVDGVDPAIPGKSYCHVLEIPEFGRIFLGEFVSQQGSPRLSMIRAELGCSVEGHMSAAVVGGGGVMVPP
jgi:hypothetical protein